MTSETDPPYEKPYALQCHLGYDLTEWRVDAATVEMPLRPFLMNRQGLPHGGMHATLLDTAMGYAGCFRPAGEDAQLALTLSLNVNYLGRPLPEAARLIARAEKTGGGRATFFARGVLTDDLGTILAEGSGVFRYRAGRG